MGVAASLLLILRSLGPVFAAALFSVFDPGQVELATDNVVSHTRQVFDASAADHDNGVLLEIVAFAADVGVNFHTVC